MKGKDKPSDGILFQRKKEGTLQWRRKPSRINYDMVKVDNGNVPLHYKSFINMD